MANRQSGPADIHVPEPVIAPITPLPPPSSAQPIAPDANTEPIAPDANTEPVQPPTAVYVQPPATLYVEPVQQLEPAAAPPPERPAPVQAAAPTLEQLVARHTSEMSALLALTDEHSKVLQALQKQDRALARNQLILAAALLLFGLSVAGQRARDAIDAGISEVPA